MTRKEWQESPQFVKLRFLNNMAFALVHQAQAVGDILDLIQAENPEITVCDKFSISCMQLRIVSLEVKKLQEANTKLAAYLTPKLDDD